MMSLPFFGLFTSLALIGSGRRRSAIFFWVLSFALLLVLLRDHVADTLRMLL
ncbi:DUF5993 family protein [Ancylobacter radicis]|uniref:Uncharacterized protein n=1 Tax=Ancylobacter radicis TaxID=2836179 RepID=A0ABS5R2R0_9HYPH|nr:DUF5993 family protein [Ancylobacter radicis]MBS9475901.1 hypothetical protein [Ancylobacter radicis]